MTECFLPPTSSPSEHRRAEHGSGLTRTPSSEEISPTKFPGLYRTGEPSPPHDILHEPPDIVSDDEKDHGKKKGKFKKKEKRMALEVMTYRTVHPFAQTAWPVNVLCNESLDFFWMVFWRPQRGKLHSGSMRTVDFESMIDFMDCISLAAEGYAAFQEDSSGDEAESPSKMKRSKGIHVFKKPSFSKKKEKDFKIKEKPKEEKHKEDKHKEKKSKDLTAADVVKQWKEKKKKKKPIQEPEVPQVDVPSLRPIFGVPLADAVERTMMYDGVRLPAVFRECIDFMEKHGMKCEGVYRVSGIKSKVDELKAAYDREESPNLEEYEPNTVASLLKQYLRDLPENLLTKELMPRFEEACGRATETEKVQEFQRLLKELPECNHLLISWLIVHMDHVIAKELETKMNIQNISIVLSPTVQISNRVLYVLFTHVQELFGTVVLKQVTRPLRWSNMATMPTLPETQAGIKEEIRRQVRQAAFQSLGPFISTFANPSSSGQCFKDEGKNSEDLPAEEKNRLKDHYAAEEEQMGTEDAPADFSASLESTREDCAAKTSGNSAGDISVPEDSSSLCTLSSESHQEAASDENDKKPDNCKSAIRSEVGTSSPDSTPLDQELFNSFYFWRTPLPEIDLDKELQQDSGERLSPENTGDAPGVPEPASPNITMATRKELEEMIENLEPHMDDPDVKAQVDVLSAALRASTLDAHEEASSIEHRSELQDDLGVSELPDCSIDQDAPGPLVSAVEEVMSSGVFTERQECVYLLTLGTGVLAESDSGYGGILVLSGAVACGRRLQLQKIH
ncbi:ralA binding protein 1 [Cricetulus griseus]